VDFVSHQEALDTSTPMGAAMFTIISAMAQLEVDILSTDFREPTRWAWVMGAAPMAAARPGSARCRGRWFSAPRSLCYQKWRRMVRALWVKSWRPMVVAWVARRLSWLGALFLADWAQSQ
jgi:hypothetical protein